MENKIDVKKEADWIFLVEKNFKILQAKKTKEAYDELVSVLGIEKSLAMKIIQKIKLDSIPNVLWI